MSFGKKYLIPTPFDPRLITVVSTAVAKAAIETGVAKKKIDDWAQYEKELKARVGNFAAGLQSAKTAATEAVS